MVFVSDVLGERIYDRNGHVVGRIRDLVMLAKSPQALVALVVVRSSDGQLLALDGSHWQTVAARFIANTHGPLPPYKELANHILLGRDVLDKQIIDVGGHKVVRVNDIELRWTPQGCRVAAVDTGTRGFTRRLLGNGALRMLDKLPRHPQPRLVSWHLVEPLGSAGSPLKLSIAWRKLGSLHPADLADIVEDLDRDEQVALFNSLDDESAAEALSEVEESADQEQILDQLGTERAADILEEMSPDDAADILAELPHDMAEALLSEMDKEEQEDVRELLRYEDNTAGGLMTPDYIDVADNLTAAEVIELLRSSEPEAEMIYYLYVCDSEGVVTGVLSLRDLIVARPSTPIRDLMTGPVTSVSPDASEDEVVDVMAKYDFLAVPVVDEQDHLLGIITVDDVMDVVMERGGWMRQLRFGRR